MRPEVCIDVSASVDSHFSTLTAEFGAVQSCIGVVGSGKTNSIQASHVLTHRTTGWTRRSLTSGIGRDRVQFT